MQDELAAAITLEQGKTFEDARGDVMRGLRKYVVDQLSLLVLRLWW